MAADQETITETPAERELRLDRLAFEEKRRQVERAQDLREERLVNWENSINEAEKKVMARESAVELREANLLEAEKAHRERVDRLRAALGAFTE